MSGTVLITGATAGIGAAAARRFAGASWKVIGTGRRAARLDGLAAELGDAFHPITLDMRDTDGIAAAVDSLPERFASVDLLVNNAGLAAALATTQDADLDNLRESIDTNITGLVAITHKLLPGLIERKGAVINLSSVAATYPYRGGATYGGTKAFVRQFSLNLRSDLHGTGVRVTSVEPGMTETEFTIVRSGAEASDALYANMKPMTGDDIAETIFWVATLPPHVNINTVEMMPVAQSFAGFQVARDS